MRCRACDLVYADPVDPGDRTYFDIAVVGQHDDRVDRDHAIHDFASLLTHVAADFERRNGRVMRRVLLVGRWHRAFAAAAAAHGFELEFAVDAVDDETQLVTSPLAETLGTRLGDFDVVLLHELLEGSPTPTRVLDDLSGMLKPDAVVAVTFANMQSLPSRMLRRRWRSFFDKKIAFYDADNLEILMWRCGFGRVGHKRLRTTYSLGYLAARLELPVVVRRVLAATRLARASARVATSGYALTVFGKASSDASEKLSVIVPVYNEAIVRP